MNTLAIIPARSGSKGLKDKNIVYIYGRPLMDYTIKAARDSKCFDIIMVSTDSDIYADIARKCGAEVPFLRSKFTSGNTAGTWDVVREVLTKYRNLGKEFDYVAVLQPTSPLRNADDIRRAFDMIKEKDECNVVSVTETAHPVQWCFKLDETCSLKEYADSPYSFMRRQDLDVHYQENGAIYFVNAKKIIDKDYNFYRDNCYAYIMPRERSIDIDEEMDLVILRAILQEQMQEGKIVI